jgi:hypothetical protein
MGTDKNPGPLAPGPLASGALAPAPSTKAGEGSYGCVYRPQLPCKKSKLKRTTKTVGKVLKKKDANVELLIGALVKSIPSWEDYYIVQEEDDCDASNFKAFRKDYMEDCKIFQSSDFRSGNMTQVVSKYGGRDFYDSIPVSSFDYLKSLKHVLQAIDKLGQRGICHYDLKENNILMDNEGVLRIIDFGGSFVGDGMTDESVKKRIYAEFIPEYNPQPPELTMMHGLYWKTGTMKKMYHDSIYDKPVFTLIETYLGRSREEAVDALKFFWNSYYTDHGEEEGWGKFFRLHWRSWDTWSVGVIFLKVLRRCLVYKPFVENTWKPHGPLIKEVLRGLLEVDPRMRLSAEGALELLKDKPSAYPVFI